MRKSTALFLFLVCPLGGPLAHAERGASRAGHEPARTASSTSATRPIQLQPGEQTLAQAIATHARGARLSLRPLEALGPRFAFSVSGLTRKPMLHVHVDGARWMSVEVPRGQSATPHTTEVATLYEQAQTSALQISSGKQDAALIANGHSGFGSKDHR